MINTGERQVAPTIAEIRKDHTNRYLWAANLLSGKIYDCGCGIGYGSQILANSGCKVVALDRDREALDYADKYYRHDNINHFIANLEMPIKQFSTADAAVAFEIIEHLSNPRPLLTDLAKNVPTLLASVPNEEMFPYQNHAYHHRHYTKAEFEALLNDCGWTVTEWHGQAGIESPVLPNVKGRTLVAVCQSKEAGTRSEERGTRTNLEPRTSNLEPAFSGLVPAHVAILGLGPSVNEYLSHIKFLGSRHKFADEVWAINGLGDMLQCDLIWHMDDVRIQEIRAAARPGSNIANMLQWMKTTTTPIMTSRTHPDYPSLVEFPLEDVINHLTFDYFNNTAAYALAYAIHIGVEKVSLFGCDYTYPKAHDAEKGRGCLEFWLGQAAARGIKISLPRHTSLMDAIYPRNLRLYGYDTRDVAFTSKPDGTLAVTYTEKTDLPTAEEIENAYDHSVHPNPLVAA